MGARKEVCGRKLAPPASVRLQVTPVPCFAASDLLRGHATWCAFSLISNLLEIFPVHNTPLAA